MSRGQKILVTAFAIYAALAGSAMAWAAMTLYGDGLMSVRVHKHQPGGARFSLTVPGSAVRAGLGAVRFIPASAELERATMELRRLGPDLQALAAAIEDCPDAVLVEIEDGRDHVLIEKRDGAFYIQVDGRDADVEVRVPAGLVSMVFETLAST